MATLFRALSDPVLTYHVARLSRQKGVSESPHIFVCGVPRAGTSLVATILSCHPTVVSFGQENDFFQRRNFSRATIPELSAAQLRSFGVNASSQSDLYDRIAYHFLGESPEKNRFLDKSPGNILHFPLIASLFPRAKFVVLMRDPRDGFISFNRHPGLRQFAADEYARLWSRFAQAVLATRGRSNARIVRYEDLCSSVAPEVRAICDHLGISFVDQMLNPDAHRAVRGAYGANSGHERIGATISAKSVGGWVRTLATPDRLAIERACAPLMTEFGYELSNR